jgi:type II secretion system protein H
MQVIETTGHIGCTALGAGYAFTAGMSNTIRARTPRAREGFTLIETIIVLVVVAILAALVAPQANDAISQSRVQNSAGVIAGDLQLAFSLASRQRAPLRIVVDPSGRKYQITNRAGTVIRERNVGDMSDLHVGSMTSTVSQLEIFPNGLASGPIAITVALNGHTQTISMTRAGQVRVTS